MSTLTIQVDSNNDILLDSAGNFTILSDVAAVAQDVRLATLMRTTEDVFDVNSGVGYFEYIFTPQQNYDSARKSISDAIISSPEVVSVEQLTVDIDANTFTYVAKIMTTFGPLTVSNQ